jgi:hypothetical protein
MADPSDGRATAYILLASGLALAASARSFHRAKMTLPFKISYFAAWPVLGTGIIRYLQIGSESRMREKLQKLSDEAT